MKRMAFLFLAAAAAACSTPAPPAEERIADYQKRCDLMGFKAGTPDNSKCILELEKVREQGSTQEPTRETPQRSGAMPPRCSDAIARGDSTAISAFCR